MRCKFGIVRDVKDIKQLNILDGSIVFACCFRLGRVCFSLSESAGPESKLKFLKPENGVADVAHKLQARVLVGLNSRC